MALESIDKYRHLFRRHNAKKKVPEISVEWEKAAALDQGRAERVPLYSPAVQGSPGAELMAGPWAVDPGSGLSICQCVLCPKKPSVRRGGRGSRAGAGPGPPTGRSPRCRTHRRLPWQIPGARHWSGGVGTGSRGEASILHTPALVFPREATPSPRWTGADLQGDVVEGVHVGGTPQEPLIQNDQEDEVDARQEAQPHVHQQEDQVEALWVQVEGRAEPGLAAGEREAAIPPVAPVLGDTEEGEGWQAGIESQHPAGLQTLGSGSHLLSTLSHTQTSWVSSLVPLLMSLLLPGMPFHLPACGIPLPLSKAQRGPGALSPVTSLLLPRAL